MKKIIFITIQCAATALFGACSDVLDITPSDRFSPSTVWSTQTTTDSYVNGFYAVFRDNAEFYNSGAYGPWLSDAFSDILKSTSWDMFNHPYNKSLLQMTAFNSQSAGAFECWDGHYTRIRRQNEFLRDAPTYGAKFNVDDDNDPSTPTWIEIREAEVRFCRAYTYYLLCRVYGGVILRTEVDGPAENDKARALEAECWNFIITELQEAAKILPTSWDSSNLGRATKKAAYALLSRVALYAQKWDVAVQAARDTETAGGQLDMSNPTDYVKRYTNIFTSNVGNVEICFGVNFSASIIGHYYDAYMRPSGDKYGTNVYSVIVPTGELADSYEMADGTPFSWATYGAAPYMSREPRFYSTILYNDADWMGRKIQSYVGGTDGFTAYVNAGSANTTVTGYYLRKFLKDGDKAWVTAGKSSQYWILIRYAEVLLNKAEALAQLNWTANSVEALQALNEVRGRVGLPARNAASKDIFMEYVRHERIVELAGEGLRYWDLRRWELAEDVINDKSAHGVKITKTGSDPDTYTYEQVEVDAGNKRIFYDRYYKFAIPETERSKNKLCDNNKGWI